MKIYVCNFLHLICASYMNYSYILMLFNPRPLRFFTMYPSLVNLYNFLKVLKTNLFVNLPLQDSKDRRIQELTMEVEHQDQLCELYRGQLITFLKNVEEQTEVLSTKIEVAVNSVRKVESEGQKHSRHRQRQQSRVRLMYNIVTICMQKPIILDFVILLVMPTDMYLEDFSDCRKIIPCHDS